MKLAGFVGKVEWYEPEPVPPGPDEYEDPGTGSDGPAIVDGDYQDAPAS